MLSIISKKEDFLKGENVCDISDKKGGYKHLKVLLSPPALG